MDRPLLLQAIDASIRIGALLLAAWFSRNAYRSLQRGFFHYGHATCTRADNPVPFWTIMVLWVAVALCCAWIAIAGS